MSSTAVPNNASLAHAVVEKDLSNAAAHLEKVHIEQAHATSTGGIHLGPGVHAAQHPVGSVKHSAVETGHSGEVSVQSSVVMDTTQETNTAAPAQIAQLLQRLSSTTTQVDEYSKRQSEAISKEANQRVQLIIAETQREQDLLLKDASARSLEIEGEYAAKLKAFLQGLDASKAGNLAALEKDLNFRQEQLLSSARDEMDSIHQAATAAKIAAMNAANAHIQADVNQLTQQVKVLGEAAVERTLNSTTTTVITTQTHAESHSQSPEVLLAKDTIVQSSSSASKESFVQSTEPRANVRI